MKTRYSTALTLALAIMCLVPALSRAADYPLQQPIKIIVPLAAGGTTDILARRIGIKLGELLGQSVIIDNRVGAGGSIGAEAVAHAPADGYTLLLASPAVAVDAVSGKKTEYDVRKDLEPVSQLVEGPFALLVTPSLPVRNVRELVDYARAHPGKLNMGSSGIGSSVHLVSELFKADAKIDVTHVPYKGAAPALNALIAGEIQILFDPLATGRNYSVTNRARAIAVTSASKTSLWPELPTTNETVPGFDMVVWFGIFAPAGTPKAIVDLLSRKLSLILATSEMREWIHSQGLEVVGSTPDAFKTRVRADIEKFDKLIKKSGVRLAD